MLPEKPEILKQLLSLEEHLGGIGKMIEEDASCLDVLRQTYAVRKAIQKLEEFLVEQHVSGCIHQRIASADEEALLAAFMQVYHLRENH
jgi:DNA-binding FrmR family transcriptional regulator